MRQLPHLAHKKWTELPESPHRWAPLSALRLCGEVPWLSGSRPPQPVAHIVRSACRAIQSVTILILTFDLLSHLRTLINPETSAMSVIIAIVYCRKFIASVISRSNLCQENGAQRFATIRQQWTKALA
jgi:hypothetical protein